MLLYDTRRRRPFGLKGQLEIDGKEVAKIHTSCSKPIDIGDVHGDFVKDDLELLPPKDGMKGEVSEEALTCARAAIVKLVNVDRILAKTPFPRAIQTAIYSFFLKG